VKAVRGVKGLASRPTLPVLRVKGDGPDLR
jgi:hypothetical protein